MGKIELFFIGSHYEYVMGGRVRSQAIGSGNMIILRCLNAFIHSVPSVTLRGSKICAGFPLSIDMCFIRRFYSSSIS